MESNDDLLSGEFIYSFYLTLNMEKVIKSDSKKLSLYKFKQIHSTNIYNREDLKCLLHISLFSKKDTYVEKEKCVHSSWAVLFF